MQEAKHLWAGVNMHSHDRRAWRLAVAEVGSRLSRLTRSSVVAAGIQNGKRQHL